MHYRPHATSFTQDLAVNDLIAENLVRITGLEFRYDPSDFTILNGSLMTVAGGPKMRFTIIMESDYDFEKIIINGIEYKKEG